MITAVSEAVISDIGSGTVVSEMSVSATPVAIVLSAAVTHMNETDGKFAAQSADKFGEFIQKFDRVYFSDKKTRDGVRRKAVNPRAEK